MSRRGNSNRAQRRKFERDLKKGPKKVNSLSNKDILYYTKYVFPQNKLTQVFQGLSEDQINFVEGNPLPKTYSDIHQHENTFYEANLEKEIKWYQFIFNRYLDPLNKFIDLEKKFEKAFLIGNYDDALRILDNIEKDICVSFWSIERRLCIAENKLGFKKNKDELTKILSEKNDILTEIFSKYLSIKVEKNLSHLKYEEILSHEIKKYDLSEIKEYLIFRLNYFGKEEYTHANFFLYFENNCSLIDRYISFKRAILTEICKKNSELKDLELIKNVALDLHKKIQDPVFTNILIHFGEDISIRNEFLNTDFIECIDLYTAGDYNKFIESAQSLLKENPLLFELKELYVKSLIQEDRDFDNIFPEGSIAFQILNDLDNIYRKNENTANSLANIHKIFNSIAPSSWSYKCFAFFNLQNSLKLENFDYEKFSFLNSFCVNPNLALAISDLKIAESFLNKINLAIPDSSTIKFFKEIIKVFFNDDGFLQNCKSIVDPLRIELYENRILLANGRISLAIDNFRKILLQLEDSDRDIIPFLQENIVHSILSGLLQQGSFKEAAQLVAKYNIVNPNYRFKFRYELLIERILEADDNELMQEISSPIVLNQYGIGDNEVWISYDNFLCTNNLNFPHEIASKREEFDDEKLIYFLKNIARQEIYHSSYLFETQDELDNERIEICLILVNIHVENAKSYKDEISEISRNLLIRKGIKQIDESKIYVDVAGIKNSLKNDLQESFERSLNLMNLSIDQISRLDQISENIIVPYYSNDKSSSKGGTKEVQLKITSYSRFQQFIDMFCKIRDKFIASNEFGIDTYLSMRIRHGTLLGETRSVFENYQLITKKDALTEKYQNNEYWSNRLELEGNKKDSFNDLMADFSKNIDDLSDELKNTWLQVKTEKKITRGLFDYSYDEKDLLGLFTDKFGNIEDYDVFFEEVINELWQRTESNLGIIRDYISNYVKSKNLDLLIELADNLNILIDKQENIRLNDLIRDITSCQTSISTEFDKISQWFRRTNNKSINDFFLHLPIDASLKTLRRIYPEYSNINPEILNESHSRFEGELFTQFTFLIQNLFENIIKHSGLPPNELDILMKISESQNHLTISIKNNISNSIPLDEKNQKIQNTRELLTRDIGELSRSEGGTGYPKIKKILLIDFKRSDFQINIFDVDENRKFKSEITFNLKGLTKSIKNNEVSIDRR